MSEDKTKLTKEELKAEMDKYIEEVETKLRDEFSVQQPTDENASEQKADITQVGTLIVVNIKDEDDTTAGLGMVLKYIEGTELKNKTDDNYIVWGMYSKEDIKKLIETESYEESPKVIIVTSKVVDKEQFEIITDDTLATELFEIAKQDSEINERLNTLFNATMMEAITSDMSKTYVENYNKRLELSEQMDELNNQEQEQE